MITNIVLMNYIVITILGVISLAQRAQRVSRWT